MTMTGVNHALTGAAMGLLFKNPLLVAPAAFASHLILDTTPHFGSDWLKHKPNRFRNWILAEGVGSALVTLIVMALWPQYWFAIGIGAFFAVLPDLLWVFPHLLGQKRPTDAFSRFHSWIQWSETPLGCITELVWFGLVISIFIRLHN
jgi:hypothetical protein